MLSIRIFNTLRQFFIFLLLFAFAPFAPIVAAIFGDVERLAQTQQRKLVTMIINELKFYG